MLDDLDMTATQAAMDDLEDQRRKALADRAAQEGRYEKTLNTLDVARRATEEQREDNQHRIRQLAGQPDIKEEEEKTLPTEVEEPESQTEQVEEEPEPEPDATEEEVIEEEEEEETETWWFRLSCFWPVLLAVVVGLITLVVMSNYADDILGWAQGDQNWGENGFVRFLFTIGPALILTYWTWIVSREHFCYEDEDDEET